MLRKLALTWICWLVVTGTVSAAEPAFKMITLQHRFTDDILPVIEPMVGENGSARAIDNHLMVTATPERMAAIEEIIARLDVQRKNLRITISHDDEQQFQGRDARVSGRARIEDAEVRLPGKARQGVAVDIAEHDDYGRRRGSEFVTVLDGEQAFIRVGQSVPYTQQWLDLTQRYAVIRQATEFRDITTGFAVRPRYLGNKIEAEITPRIARLDQSGMVDFNELTTVVQVAPGEWLDLGGIMQSRDEVSRAILQYARDKNTRNSRLKIRIE